MAIIAQTSGKAMTPLASELRRKFKTPQAALKALGLDGFNINDEKGKFIMATKLSKKAESVLGALNVFLRPKLAADAKVDLTSALAGVTDANFKEKKASVLSSVISATSGKLAQDADVHDVMTLLDALEPSTKEAQMAELSTEPNAGAPFHAENKTEDAFPENLKKEEEEKKKKAEDRKRQARDKFKHKMSEDDWKAYDADCMDEEPKKDQEGEPKQDPLEHGDAELQKDLPGGEQKPQMVTPKAMDAAIKVAVKAATDRMRDTAEAVKEVRPYVGELAMAHDSAISVYRTALSAMGVKDTDKIDNVFALKAILAAQPKVSDRKQPAIAQDAAAEKSFAERFPGAAKITIL